MSSIKLIPDSATGYEVFKDGESIGRIERNSRDRNPWRYYAANGGFGSEIRTRRKAIECLLELWEEA